MAEALIVQPAMYDLHCQQERAWAVAPARAPEIRRCTGVMSSKSSTIRRLMWSLALSFIAVSGVILITLVPLPRKNARSDPAGVEGTCQAPITLSGNK